MTRPRSAPPRTAQDTFAPAVHLVFREVLHQYTHQLLMLQELQREFEKQSTEVQKAAPK